MSPHAERVIVAMSGGVDSSVAAALLHEQGYEVLGITLQLWGKETCVSSGTRLCCSVRDAMDAKVVARRLGIRHEVLERVEEFRRHVIDYFVESYRQGSTPNPCIACNDHIKFGSLIEHARAQGAVAVATGHYARVGYDAARERYTLRRSLDPQKDQSYVLCNLTQSQLAQARFPLGSLNKSRVRDIARSLGLATAEKPDSQDVCFVRDRNKDGFLRRALSSHEEPGPITDVGGHVLGSHRGLLGFTIGQREGLGLSVGRPLYVVAIDQPNNRLIVGSREDLLSRALVIDDVNWVSIAPPTQPLHAQVKIRSRHAAAPALVSPESPRRVRVQFDEPQSAVTPGQAAALYDDELLLGGGWISRPTSEVLAKSDACRATC